MSRRPTSSQQSTRRFGPLHHIHQPARPHLSLLLCDEQDTTTFRGLYFLYELCTPQAGYSSAKLQSELGYTLPHTDLEVTLGDTLTAMKKLGMLKKKYN